MQESRIRFLSNPKFLAGWKFGSGKKIRPDPDLGNFGSVLILK